MGLIEPGQSAKGAFYLQTPSRRSMPRLCGSAAPSIPRQREFMIELSPDGLPRNWALGQRASVAIDVFLPPETLVVPLAFVARRDGRAGVWRRVLGRAIWAPIEAGAVSGKYLQVLHGVAPGDLVLDPRGRYTFEAVAIEGSLKVRYSVEGHQVQLRQIHAHGGWRWSHDRSYHRHRGPLSRNRHEALLMILEGGAEICGSCREILTGRFRKCRACRERSTAALKAFPASRKRGVSYSTAGSSTSTAVASACL